MISAERLKEKRIRACRHAVLTRCFDDESGEPADFWRCADCPAVFKMTPASHDLNAEDSAVGTGI